MTVLYFCSCVHPLVDVESPEQCRRCLLDVSTFRLVAEGLQVNPLEDAGASRRAELVERLSPLEAPEWDAEAGNVDGRLLVALVAAAAVVLVVVMFWQWIVGAGVMFAAYRHLTRGTRRRRPRSSAASIMQAGGVLLAGWNSRGLVRRNGRPLRVSVPAKAGREHRDEYGEIPF